MDAQCIQFAMRPIALQTPVPYGRKAYAENMQGYIWHQKLTIKVGPHLQILSSDPSHFPSLSHWNY